MSKIITEIKWILKIEMEEVMNGLKQTKFSESDGLATVVWPDGERSVYELESVGMRPTADRSKFLEMRTWKTACIRCGESFLVNTLKREDATETAFKVRLCEKHAPGRNLTRSVFRPPHLEMRGNSQ